MKSPTLVYDESIVIGDDGKRSETTGAAPPSQPLSVMEREALSIAASKLDLWDWDLTTGTKAISKRSAKLIGLTTEEFAALDTAWTDLIHPEDLPRIKDAIIPHLKGKTPLFAVEFRARRKSGGWIWLLSQGNVVDRDERGFATRVLGFDIDITERKSTESAILSQKELALALSATSDLDQAFELCVDAALSIAGLDGAGIYIADGSGNLNLVTHKGVSNEFAQACAIMPADLPGTQAVLSGLPRYMHAREVAPPIRGILEREGLQAVASLPIAHGGSVIASFYLASRTLLAIPNSIRHLLESLASQIGGAITRIRAENLLKESEERFRTFAEGLPQIVFEVDTEGKFIFVNKAAYEYAGRSPEEVRQGLSVAEVVLPSDRERLRRNMARIVTGEEFVPEEYETFRNDGSRAVIVTYSSPVVKEGNVVAIRGLCVDITPLKEAEARLKEALEEKEVLLRELHHRVKNNLQVIQSLLRLQARQMRDDAFLSMVRETENRISAMALMHEQYCRSDNLADLNVTAYVSRIVDYLVASRSHPGRSISVDKEIQVVHLSIDTAMHLGLLLTELLINCLKYAVVGASNGRIRIALRTLTEDRFELIVGHNGADRQEEFGDDLLKTAGLRLVDTLVRQVDGTIEATHNHGQEFRITFRDLHRPRTGDTNSHG